MANAVTPRSPSSTSRWARIRRANRWPRKPCLASHTFTDFLQISSNIYYKSHNILDVNIALWSQRSVFPFLSRIFNCFFLSRIPPRKSSFAELAENSRFWSHTHSLGARSHRESGQAETDLGALGVSCGGHRAAECGACEKGRGPSWSQSKLVKYRDNFPVAFLDDFRTFCNFFAERCI